MPDLKNQKFINNITDPRTGKQVKKIYQMKLTKLNRIVEPMVWEYYKNRANMSIEDIYKKYNGYKLKIIFFGDPIIYEVENGENVANNSKIDLIRNQKNNKQKENETKINNSIDTQIESSIISSQF
jgi:hypothetical protein